MDIEKSILGALITDIDAISAADALGLTAEDFETENHRIVFRAIVKTRAAGDAVDPLSLETAVGPDLEKIGGIGFLYSLIQDLSGTVNAPRWIEKLIAAARRRSLDGLLRTLPTLDTADPDAAAADVRRRLENFERGARSLSKARRMSDMFADLASFTIRTYALGETFRELNKKDYALIRDGLITIGAEANAGKSSLLSALALDILRHDEKTCFLFYTLDDAVPISGKRILSQITGLNQFNSTGLEIVDAEKELTRRIVLEDRLNIDALKREAAQVKELCRAEKIIIGIDYLQIIPNRTDLIQREFLNDTVKALKEIQKALDPGCLMILLSQLNRDTKQTGFRYRETSEIENQSDVCFDIKGDEKDKENPEREIVVTKNKLGRKGRTWKTEINESFRFLVLKGKHHTSNTKRGAGDAPNEFKTR